jgi:hypothetical protein
MFMPKSSEATFCVVSTSESGKDQRLLEKDCQLVIGGADAYGMQRTERRSSNLGEPNRPIIPVIVTNAKLFEATYEASSVALDTGQILSSPDLSPLKWVRFRKAFTSNPKDTGDRTVFVVSAQFLAEFLESFQIINEPQSEEGRAFLGTRCRA